MSSSLLKRFQASRESAPVESPLDTPASIHDDAGKVVAAVEPAVPSTTDTASGLPAEPVTQPVDAAGVAKDESADKNVVAAVKPAVPSSSDASGLPASPVKEATADTAAVADDKADAENKTAAAVQSVTPHHATEDLDPEAAQVQPASVIVPTPDHARETEAAYRAVEEATLGHAVEELDRVQGNLESLRDRIQSANGTGGLSAESAFFASFAVESFLKRFEIKDEAIVGSFEAAVVVPDGKTVVSTEALDASLEAVDGFGKRLKASFVRSLNPVWTRVKMLGASLSSVANEAKKIKASGKAPTIEVKSRLIAEGNETSKDLPASFSKAAEVLKYMVNGFGKQAEQDYRSNMKLMWDNVYKKFHDPGTGSDADWEGISAEEVLKAMDTIAAGWKDPRVKIGGDPTQPLIGNWQLFAEEKDEDSGISYRGSHAGVKKLAELAYKAYPTMAGSAHADGDANSGVKVEVPALSPQEIVKIAQAFQSATANFGAWKAFTEKVGGITTLAAVFGPAAALMAGPYALAAWAAWVAVLLGKTIKRHTLTTGSELQEFHVLWHAQNTANRMRLHVGYDAGLVLVHIGNAFVKIAKQSLNAYAKASVEAFDQQTSLDGVSVNETAPNEPRQVPAEGHTATEKELMAKQDSWEDQPASFQTIEAEGVEAIDFDEAVSSCESLLEEASELAILQQHYATEDEASGEAKARPGMVERIKALVAKIGEFFRSVWKRIVKFVTQQGNRLVDWAEAVRKHHFEKVTVSISGAEEAYINGMKLPNLSPFYDFMDEAADAGENVAKALEDGGHKKPLMEKGGALFENAKFMSLGTGSPIPAEGMVGAFKLNIEDGKLVETQIPKKIEQDVKVYTLTGSSLASFVDGAAKLIKKAEARVKAFEMKSDADWKRAKDAADKMGPNAGLFNLKPYGESARYLMKAFSVLQSWARAVGAFAEKCIKGASAKLQKKDDIQDADFTPAAEALIQESNELQILSKHYAMEAEGGESAGPSKGYVERIKAFLKKVGEFFAKVWKQVRTFLTNQASKFKAKAEDFRRYHFEKVTVEIPGELLAYQPADLKVPDFSDFEKFLTITSELARTDVSGGILSEKRDREGGLSMAEDFQKGYHDGYYESLKKSLDFGYLPAPMPGAFKIEIDMATLSDGLKKEMYAAKEPEAQSVTVTHAKAASLLENAYRTVERLEKHMAKQEQTMEAQRQRLEAHVDQLLKDGKANAKLLDGWREEFKAIMKLAQFSGEFSAVFHHWTNACLSILSRVEQAAGAPKAKAATESQQNLPYWYHPAEA